MLLNNYANTSNQNSIDHTDDTSPKSNSTYSNSKRGLSRFLYCNNDNSNENQYHGNTGFSTILFFILILLILFNFNSNNT